ncbi:selenophosphate synthase [Rubrobacter xylanophilus DSM 9941]|uniref:Selenophosphate synthase n=1 Tax=Rubrobacter xylanophilus (strain DSM 9941 / JCM 11954 / NBRC 16129 / PRD-1) TaxID=266117 RepID=Q1AX51_RUBXD|nr:selenophosphate synthase [Rubrobacter xylanophilus DSM 9941]
MPFGGGLLLQSADFFPPIVDDPYRFGQIAAANALSDIYAMGGEPLTAMNLVGFPCSLDLGVLREILAGGLSKIEESGARLCGGHSVDDREPKYGLAVTGFVTRERLVRNAGAAPGDALVLTKPLGFGILTTALKRDLLAEEEIGAAVEAAATLNRAARDAMLEAGPSAATDVTGYGLLGHLSEMLRASRAGAVVRRGDVPVWERAQRLAAEGCYPGGLKSNREYLRGAVLPEGVDETAMLPLYDPQTSGGLLISLPAGRAGDLLAALRRRGIKEAAVIGEVTAGEGIRVLP